MDKDLTDPKATRSEVYDAIDTERVYQSEVVSGDPMRCMLVPKSVGDYVTMLTAYISRTQQTWCDTPGNEQTLHFIRKIAGIAVKCMEQHGAPERKCKPI